MNTTFTDGITVVTSDWLNDVNDTVYDILGDGVNPPTDAAALLANLGGATITDVNDAITNAVGVTTQAYSPNLDEFATVNPTAAGLALLDDVDAAAQRTTLGLGSDATGTNLSSLTNTTTARSNLDAQQTLVSGTNIKTVNGTPLLGSGDVSISTTVSDGDKGDIIVSSGGTVWTIDPTIIPHPLTSGTAINTTSGTAHDFTAIPSWVKRITLLFSGVSTNSTSPWLIQLGDSGGIETSGYIGGAQYVTGGYPGAVGVLGYTAGLGCVSVVDAAQAYRGRVVVEHLQGNSWVLSGQLTADVGSSGHTSNAEKTLSTTLDRIRLTTVSGTSVFDAGSVNILYE